MFLIRTYSLLCVSIDDQATADRPTLIECIRFRGRERRINIPQEIGIKYYQFGLLLLENDTRTRIQALTDKHMKDTEHINMEVLQQWLAGRGKRPITWMTLTKVLHDIELSTLAGEVEAVKCHKDKANGDVPVGISDNHFQIDQMTISTVESVEGSEQRSTRDIPTAGMEDRYCEMLKQRVDVAADLSDSKDSREKEKNQLARNVEAEVLAIDCENSEENQENQRTGVQHGTGRTDTRPLLNQPLDL